MENLALTTLMLPLSAHWSFRFSPQRRAAEWGVLFAALTTLCMLSLISAFYQADKVAVTLTLVNVGDVALFGLVIDRVSTLILFVVVFLGLLVTIYSTGYLTDKNREHPHNGTNRYYAFLLVFIGAMSELHGDARYLVLWRHPVCRVGEIGPATDASVATGCNGSANTDQCLSPRRIDGESGRLHFLPAPLSTAAISRM
ncbi:hydrogenase-4 component D [Escherichia coli]|uniref:Hydrogenase-4 component D n=1 Tax=Escherichia coli TaxID=562 RepID=A0A377D3M3_ECOLX|nr:hydrogenase-4 component D [Escherichia coli]